MNPCVAATPPPEMSIFRDFTVRLLRRYLYLSVQLGRVPDILGREFFRSRVSVRRAPSFEGAVVFVHDVSRCLERLHPFDQQVIARCVLQEYTHDEAARLLHCSKRTVEYRLPDALDALTTMLLDRHLMVIERPRRAAPASGPCAPAPEKALADPVPGVIPELSACGNLFVKPPEAVVSV
jgi:hypothetical protein